MLLLLLLLLSSNLIDMCQQQNSSTSTYVCLVCLSYLFGHSLEQHPKLLVMIKCQLTIDLILNEECLGVDGSERYLLRIYCFKAVALLHYMVYMATAAL